MVADTDMQHGTDIPIGVAGQPYASTACSFQVYTLLHIPDYFCVL